MTYRLPIIRVFGVAAIVLAALLMAVTAKRCTEHGALQIPSLHQH